MNPHEICNRPLAAPGLISYRCRGRYGWIMIGANSHDDAMREARRSTDAPGELQVWTGNGYAHVPCPACNGEGYVESERAGEYTEPCQVCEGAG